MTQLRCDPGSIRNEVDRILEGIGHRGSSFSDLDAISHDVRTHRFLVQEFKRPGEALSAGQRLLLTDLSLEARFTVWYVMVMRDGQIAWADMRWPDSIDVISQDDYRARFAAWWDNRYAIEQHAAIATELPVRT